MKFKIFYIFIAIILILACFDLTASAAAKKKTTSKTAKKQEPAKTAAKAEVYKIPARAILVSPYLTYVYAKDLYTDTVKDKSAGFGGGVNLRSQVYKEFGYFLDVFVLGIKLQHADDPAYEHGGAKMPVIFTGGLYYALPNWKFDIAYGAIAAGINIMTIFIPGVEYYMPISPRINFCAKIGCLVTNDWFANMDYKEHYTSYTLSVGVSFVF